MIQFFITTFLLLILLTYLFTFSGGPIGLINYLFRYRGRGLGFILIYLLVLYQSFGQPLLPLYPQNIILLSVTGLCLAAFGFTVFFLAKFNLGSSWGMPAQHDVKQQYKLVTRGVYYYSRNPIYVGLFIFYIGCELMVNSALIFLAIPIAYVIHSFVLREEHLLQKHFPSVYSDYFASTPRYL